MKILINQNTTVTASAMEKYCLAAALPVIIRAVSPGDMAGAMREERPDIVMVCDDRAEAAELTRVFEFAQAYDEGIRRVLIAGKDRLPELDAGFVAQADELLVFPFVTQELLVRLRRLHDRLATVQTVPPERIQPPEDAAEEPEESPTESFAMPLPPVEAVFVPSVDIAVPDIAVPPEETRPADMTAPPEDAEEEPPESPEEADAMPLPPMEAFFASVADIEDPEPTVRSEETMPPEITVPFEDGTQERQEPPVLTKKRGPLKKIAAALSKLLVVVLILIISVLAVLIITAKINDGTPMVFGWQFYTVLTGSMDGKLPDSFGPGSLILVKPVNPEDIKVGDVITFDRRSGDAKMTTHRVKVITRDAQGKLSFITKGDANAVPDSEPVAAGIVRGKVVYRFARVGEVVQFAQTGTGMIFTVFIPAGAIVIYEIVIFSQEFAEKRRQKKTEGHTRSKKRKE